VRLPRIGNGLLIALVVLTTGGFVAIGSTAISPHPAAADSSKKGHTVHTVESGNAWANIENIGTVDDTTYATQSLIKNAVASTKFSNFGFDAVIPPGSTITNAVATVRYRISNCSGFETCNTWFKIDMWSGATSKISAQWQHNASTNNTLYSRSVTSNSITRAELLDNQFAIELRAARENNGSTATLSVDSLSVTVNFIPPANTAPLVSTPTNDCSDVMHPGEECTFTFTTTDAEGLTHEGGVGFCLYQTPDDTCGAQRDTWLMEADDEGGTDTRYDGIGDPSFDVLSFSFSGTWSQTDPLTWTVKVKAHSDAAVGDWEFVVVAIDGYDFGVAAAAFAIENSAPVISNPSSECGAWTREEPCSVVFTVTDPGGLGPSGELELCLRRSVWGTPCDTEAKAESFFLTPDGSDVVATVDGVDGPFTYTITTVGDAWADSVVQWRIEFRPGALTELGGDWYLDVAARDSSALEGTVLGGPFTIGARPTLLNPADSCAGEWIPGEECTFSFRTFDPDPQGLGSSVGAQITLCFWEGEVSGDLKQDVEGACVTPDGVTSAVWAVFPTSDTTELILSADDVGMGSNQSWAVAGISRSAAWTSQTIDWTVTVRIGAIAKASSEWNLSAVAWDHAGRDAVMNFAANTVATTTVVTVAESLDFGELAVGANSDVQERSVSVRCNVQCVLQASTHDWTHTGTGRSITPSTNWAVDPGTDEFALLCRNTSQLNFDSGISLFDEDDGQRVGTGWVSLAYLPDHGYDFSDDPMVLETQGDIVLECAVKNGSTQPGTYTGTVSYRAVPSDS